TKAHAIQCLQMRRRLMTPGATNKSLSFLLNQLPARRSRSFDTIVSWTICWPAVRKTLYEFDHLRNSNILPSLPDYLEQRLLGWFPPS
ncbi:hypothetical protein BD560DRAFT_316734, partial [Blakeslea trispora]